MKILLGGTFSVLHEGHKKMIDHGLKLGDLYIGITSDNYKFQKNYSVPPYEERKRNVENYIESKNGKAFISPLENPYGSTLSPEFDGMIVSNETLQFSMEINMIRKSRGIAPLTLYNVGQVIAEDFMPIKSERIIKGEINEKGQRLKPIKVRIASKNPEKILGVKSAISQFHGNFQFMEEGAVTEIEQPFGEEIIEMGKSRCNNFKDEDFCISIEAGVMEIFKKYFDVHLAYIKDRYGGTSVGISSGLPLTNLLVDSLKGGINLTETVSKSIGIDSVGSKGGAVFYFSRGIKLRRDLVKEAVLSALMERLSQQVPIVREYVVSLP